MGVGPERAPSYLYPGAGGAPIVRGHAPALSHRHRPRLSGRPGDPGGEKSRLRAAHGESVGAPRGLPAPQPGRSEEHTSELQSLMRISYAVFCLKKKKKMKHEHNDDTRQI